MHLSLPSTQEDRLRLIGELLCKGILCSPSLHAMRLGGAALPEPIPLNPEERILEYLRRHESASPAEMRAVLKLSRTRTSQALQRLLLSRQIARNDGRTSATAYRLAFFDPSRN
jgi:hypothetical protein